MHLNMRSGKTHGHPRKPSFEMNQRWSWVFPLEFVTSISISACWWRLFFPNGTCNSYNLHRRFMNVEFFETTGVYVYLQERRGSGLFVTSVLGMVTGCQFMSYSIKLSSPLRPLLYLRAASCRGDGSANCQGYLAIKFPRNRLDICIADMMDRALDPVVKGRNNKHTSQKDNLYSKLSANLCVFYLNVSRTFTCTIVRASKIKTKVKVKIWKTIEMYLKEFY